MRQALVPMAEKPAKPTREERLAAKLRENLRRRKAQSREMDTRTEPVAGQEEANATLSKEHGNS